MWEAGSGRVGISTLAGAAGNTEEDIVIVVQTRLMSVHCYGSLLYCMGCLSGRVIIVPNFVQNKKLSQNKHQPNQLLKDRDTYVYYMKNV